MIPSRAPRAADLRCESIRVRGIVQGVGFRPHVYRLATELGLGGHVGNDADGVFIELIGPRRERDVLVERLLTAPPPLARIDTVGRSRTTSAPRFEPFRIVESRDGDHVATRVAPDTAVCADCLTELDDPTDRRHGHPFITCTNCGPRFTIVTGLPYDRPRTTMAPFEMCDACRAEYSDPTNRRYHAQPIGCHDCGPTLSWHSQASIIADPHDVGAIGSAAALLRAGRVVAAKGIGGYHLVANAADDAAVASIRARKHRPDKPFAVMVRNLDVARRIARVDDGLAALLASPAAPIVLCERRADLDPAALSALIAPGNPLVGVMLPYSPVHHLLFAATRLDALVMTSANHSGEPLLYRDDPETRSALEQLADGVLTHDREIRVPVDDSVMRLLCGRLLPIRVGRGYAPIVLPLPSGPDCADAPDVLAVGGELKNAAALATAGQVWLSAHIGDMGNLDTLRAFERSADLLTALTGATPVAIAHDLHPGYHTTGWARRTARTTTSEPGPHPIAVQHHHAHIAAVAAEHGYDQPVLGVAYDGTGYGTDGTIWGGEMLYCDGGSFTRVGHLATIELPGGDTAISQPWRAALAHLRAAGIDWAEDLPPVAAVAPNERALFDTQLRRGFGTVSTSSMGRLFDAIASLLGIRHAITYEAQAAIELEHAARHSASTDTRSVRYPVRWSIAPDWSLGGEPIVLDPTPMLSAIVADLRAGVPIEAIAACAHDGIATATMDLAVDLAARLGCDTIALSGGVFQNALFTERCLAAGDAGNGPRIISHHIVPPNDGGLALGQAAVAVRVLPTCTAPDHTHRPQRSPLPSDMKAGSPCV